MANPAPDHPPRELEEAYQQKLAEQRGQFQAVVDEANAALKAFRELVEEERRKREAAQAELENLQKGSVAMMKYVTGLQRKKHDEELEALAREQRVRSTRTDSLDEDDLSRQRKELDEQFQRLKEERGLLRAEADTAFTDEMAKLPEMQRLIVERDDIIKELTAKAEADAAELRTMRLRESLAKANLRDLPGGPELERRLAEWSDTNVALRHRLAEKEKEFEDMKHEFEVKLRNTLALQRIRYETEIKELREGRRGRVGLLRPKTRR